jgi:hypothetical protein
MRPFMQGSDDWVRLHTRGVYTRVNNFRILSLSNWDSYYEPTIHMVIERCDEVLPKPKTERELDLAFGSFGTKPVSCSSASEVRSYQIARDEVVLVGPSSRIVFELTPGKHQLTGAFGLLRESLDHSDGVDFTVALMTKEGRRTLLEKQHQPRTEQELSVPIDLEFEAQAGERLLLLTSNQPDKNPDFDLAYWDEIKID